MFVEWAKIYIDLSLQLDQISNRIELLFPKWESVEFHFFLLLISMGNGNCGGSYKFVEVRGHYKEQIRSILSISQSTCGTSPEYQVTCQSDKIEVMIYIFLMHINENLYTHSTLNRAKVINAIAAVDRFKNKQRNEDCEKYLVSWFVGKPTRKQREQQDQQVRV